MWNDVIEYGIANGYWGHVRIMTERVSVSGIPGRRAGDTRVDANNKRKAKWHHSE